MDALLGLTADSEESSRGGGGPADGPTARAVEGALLSVPVDAIEPNEYQPRSRFDAAELESLAESIAALGVLQPVLVRHIDESRYELIAGERRWRAAQLAGLASIPAIVREAGDQESLEHAVVENLHRSDLTPLEEAAAYQQLIDDFGLTQEQVSRRVGKSRSAVTNLLRLFQLPSSVQRLIASRQLSAGHARALLAFPDRLLQEELAARVVRDGLSVRQVEELVRAASRRSAVSERSGGRGSGGAKPASLLEVERLLAERLDTRVEVLVTKGRRRLVIEFADEDDLDRIARLLLP